MIRTNLFYHDVKCTVNSGRFADAASVGYGTFFIGCAAFRAGSC